jgi:hypothetical protein
MLAKNYVISAMYFSALYVCTENGGLWGNRSGSLPTCPKIKVIFIKKQFCEHKLRVRNQTC